MSSQTLKRLQILLFHLQMFYIRFSPADFTEAAFYLCAYEFAIKAVNSPWCQLFDEVDAKVGAISDQLASNASLNEVA